MKMPCILMKRYFKDKINVYSILGKKVTYAHANTFSEITLKDTVSNILYNYGIDKNRIYFNVGCNLPKT